MVQEEVHLDAMNYDDNADFDMNFEAPMEIYKPNQGTVEYQEKQYEYKYDN